MSKMPWERNRAEITADDWAIACNFHPSIRNAARDLRVCNAIRHFLYKDTPYCWPTQETLRQLAHVADRTQLQKSLKSIRGCGALSVLPFADMPDSLPAKRRDARGVFYRLNFQWAFETLLNHYGQHQQEPAPAKAGREAKMETAKPNAPSDEENNVAAAATYSDPNYVAAAVTNYVAAAATLNNKGTLREEEAPSCGSPAFAFGGSATAPLALSYRYRDITHPGPAFIVGDREPDDDLSIEEQIDIDEYRLSDAVYIEDWLSQYKPDNETYRRIVRLAERGELEMHHLKEVA